MGKVLITIDGEEVASRFDLCSEVWLGRMTREGEIRNERILVLPKASPDELCQLILTENISILICGGIESEYYEYLIWKKIKVFDSVIGNYQDALQALMHGHLNQGSILWPQEIENDEDLES